MKVGVGIVGGAAAVVVGAPTFSVDSVGRGTKRAGAPHPVSRLSRGGLATVSSFLAVGAGPAGGAVPNHENNGGASVLVVAEGLSPEGLLAGANIGAVVEANVEGAARPRPNEGGCANETLVDITT